MVFGTGVGTALGDSGNRPTTGKRESLGGGGIMKQTEIVVTENIRARRSDDEIELHEWERPVAMR